MKKSQARVLAAAKGERYYVPEAPCARGHTQRLTAGGSCVECRRMAENKRVAANRKAYNARKKQERANKLQLLAEKARQARANETPEQRASRLEKAKENQRKWREQNAGRLSIKEAKAKYKQNNPHKVRADTVQRRAAKMHRTPSWLTEDDVWMIEEAYELAARRTKTFGFPWHVDHIIPLQGKYVSGLHVPINLQVIPWRDNVSKANKYLPA